jgi:SNF2 family DNA or RNA helicase
MIARKKMEVNIPLPEIKYHTLNVDPREYEVNKEFVLAYNVALDELETMLHSNVDAGSIIGLMQQLRHHTGRMKIMAAAVWIDSWMTMNPGEKLCVGIHHKGVREALAKLLAHRNPLQMSDENPKEKDEIEQKFRNGHNLLIASIISAGTGRNFQFCRNALILERQWNRSKEDQFAQRFWRIISDEHGRVRTNFTEADTVNIWTMNANPSFDEFFEDMIHLKGIIVDSVDEDEDIPEESFTLKLAHEVVRKRMKWIGA